MPVLASIYAMFLAFVAIASLCGNVKDKEPLWYTALGFAADLIILVLFVQYWMPPLGRSLSPVALILFLFSLLWFVGWIPHHLVAFEARDFSPEMNRLYKRFVLVLGIALSFPAYWFAGIAVFRSI